ncbi:MAG: hypothetical protein J1F31_01800 [Erysipelotrichales bacterium]|nr:hypothetical protein [Erysipelotrichales bacterium]
MKKKKMRGQSSMSAIELMLKDAIDVNMSEEDKSSIRAINSQDVLGYNHFSVYTTLKGKRIGKHKRIV